MVHNCVYLTLNGARCRKKSVKGYYYCQLHMDAYNKTINTLTPDYFYNNPTEIVKGLFLGSENKVCNERWLTKYNIKTVVNATDELMCEYTDEVKYYMWYLQDFPNERIGPYLEKTAKIIDSSLKKKEGILIHCHMGISRSASLVWYWLATRKYGNNLKDAMAFLELKRWIVNPNDGFRQQVQKYIISRRI